MVAEGLSVRATEEAVTEPALCRPKDELPPPPRKLLSLEERLPLFDETDAVGVDKSLMLR